MRILTAGHRYELENFQDKMAGAGQVIQFIEKAPQPNPTTPGDLYTVHDGTTNEDVLVVLIDRLQFLNGKFPCRENAIALTHIETALLWLGKRTSDRVTRGVEGKHKA